jgi:tetratricopeptide (TPR) repeat protein
MTRTTSDPLDDRLCTLWRSACDDYAKETGIALSDGDFPKISGPEDLSRQLDAEKDHFEDFRMKRRPLLHAMQMILAPFENWGDLLAGAASAAFPPASSIMGAMMLLVRGARRVSESFDMLTDLFHKLSHFALRLDSYKGVPLSEGMKSIIVKVLVNFLRVCAASQKLLSRGSLRARLTKWTKNVLVEDTSISSLLGELEELTSQEHKMVSAHGLDLTHQALRNTAELLERDDNRNERERLDTVKKALEPVSASGRVFSSINENRIPGSGSWIEDRIRSWWQSPEPLLWIHGGPGVGKSYLASKIISDLAAAEPSAPSAPIVASFFFKNNDVDLRSFNKALRTLAWQVVVQRSRFAAHAEDFCLKEDPANSYVVWRKLLLDYFVKSPPDAGTCFIIDGIDEADPEEQEILFSLLESTYATEDQTNLTAPIRVVLLGRDSVRGILDEHSLGWVPEIEITNNQNKDDLHGYVSQKLQKTKLFRGYPEFLDEVVQDICGQAEGLWEWANLVIKSVLRCRSKEQIRKVVRTMPRGISAMLNAELQRLARELSASGAMSTELSDGEGSSGEATTQIQQLNLLLSFVTMAQKPLTVDQLDLILEIILEEEVLNLEDDLRTVYSSLFSLRPAVEEEEDEDAVIVTLRHSSFYEFFSASVEAGPIQVVPDRAEASFVFVLLYALQRRNAPKSERFLGPISSYAQKFLPLHLERANPEKAANREEIATQLAALLTDEPVLDPQHWLIEQYHVIYVATYNQYMSSRATEIACYWWNTQKRDTANQRAELVLNWLSPDTKQLLQDCARSSTVASDACPFTVLFSRLAESFSRLWLNPKDIEVEEGLPEGLSTMLFVYAQMAGTEFPTSEGKLAGVVRIALRTVEIMQVAEMQRLEKTPVWHARVAQALLLHNNFKTALEQFQISLDKNHQNPILSKQALSAIHRDMARACTETGRYKEALEHSDLAESLHDASWDRAWQDPIGRLLNAAQMKHFAKMTDKAVVTANEAWESFLEQTDNYGDRYTLHSFWSVFLELHQTHRVQDVLDFAASHSREFQWTEKEGLVEFLASTMTWTPRLIYRVLHHTRMRDDGKLIDLVASAAARLEASVGEITDDLATAKYFTASLMVENSRISAGIQTWYQLAALDHPREEMKRAQVRSLSRLAAVCLYHPEIPFCDEPPLRLDEKAEYSDICLVISSWLRYHGDLANARTALRGRVKKSIEVLSDDIPWNDVDAFLSLFQTFLTAADSDEDLSGALYLTKAWYRDYLREAKRDNPISEGGVAESLNQVHLADDETQVPDDEVSERRISYTIDYFAECSNCKCEMRSICHWYLCCCCPFMMLCQWCYRDIKSTLSQDGASHPSGICDPGHEFYYTGGPLLAFERVPEGMMVLDSLDGKRRTAWIEEWKDQLSEKWETADFAFEGGLSAWCMRVLPEPQRSRWARFFQCD